MVAGGSYRPAAPAALETLAAALRGSWGRPRFVGGFVIRSRGTVVIDPIAIVADTIVLPDLAPGDGSEPLPAAEPPPVDLAIHALDNAIACCAEAAHRGLRHLPASFAARVQQAAGDLTRAGLPTAGRLVDQFASALSNPETAIAGWVDAQLRLITTADGYLAGMSMADGVDHCQRGEGSVAFDMILTGPRRLGLARQDNGGDRMAKARLESPVRAETPNRSMKRIVVRRTESIKVTSDGFLHQPLPVP